MINKILGSVAVVALLVGGWALYNTFQTQPTQPAQQFGATPGTDFQSPISVGGFYTYSSRIPMTSSASTTCQFRSPRTGTSTLTFLSVQVTANPAASIYEVGNSTGPDATTTLFGTKFNVGAGAQATFNASTTIGAAADATILAPGTWVAVKTNPQVNKGTCVAEFQVN